MAHKNLITYSMQRTHASCWAGERRLACRGGRGGGVACVRLLSATVCVGVGIVRGGYEPAACWDIQSHSIIIARGSRSRRSSFIWRTQALRHEGVVVPHIAHVVPESVGRPAVARQSVVFCCMCMCEGLVVWAKRSCCGNVCVYYTLELRGAHVHRRWPKCAAPA